MRIQTKSGWSIWRESALRVRGMRGWHLVGRRPTGSLILFLNPIAELRRMIPPASSAPRFAYGKTQGIGSTAQSWRILGSARLRTRSLLRTLRRRISDGWSVSDPSIDVEGLRSLPPRVYGDLPWRSHPVISGKCCQASLPHFLPPISSHKALNAARLDPVIVSVPTDIAP